MIIIEHALCVAMFNSELRTKLNDQNVFSNVFRVTYHWPSANELSNMFSL